ncbi:MAG: PIG-L family deacetylase [Dehalococcoidia bacterium]|nr:PIG-L family deacetylase [Dehalococcoidia bacterium]
MPDLRPGPAACDLLVFSAHAADFCSRCGGAIALAARAGRRVHVVDLTVGARGESEDYWTRPGAAGIDDAARVRRAEAGEAAAVLGATIEFLDGTDYPLLPGAAELERLARILRERRPRTVLTHWDREPYNLDHQETARAVRRAATIAAVSGFDPGEPVLRHPAVFAFEPTIPLNDQTGFAPTHYVVVDEVFDLKLKALACLRSQSRLAAMYTQWGEYRGAQARQIAGGPVRYAEAFYRHTPAVGGSLPE